jgi:hypothetical protein
MAAPTVEINLGYIINIVAFGGLGFFLKTWINGVDKKIGEKVDERICAERRAIEEKVSDGIKESCTKCREKIDKEIMPHIHRGGRRMEDRLLPPFDMIRRNDLEK